MKSNISYIAFCFLAVGAMFVSADGPQKHDHSDDVARSIHREGDPHTWPEWRKFQHRYKTAHPVCEWLGCGEASDDVHHCIPVSFVIEAGLDELVYTEGGIQRFKCVCRHHHEILHGRGWIEGWSFKDTFDPCGAESCSAGETVGKWPFKSRKEAVKWIKETNQKYRDINKTLAL